MIADASSPNPFRRRRTRAAQHRGMACGGLWIVLRVHRKTNSAHVLCAHALCRSDKRQGRIIKHGNAGVLLAYVASGSSRHGPTDNNRQAWAVSGLGKEKKNDRAVFLSFVS